MEVLTINTQLFTISITILLSYLLGSIPTGLWVGKIFFKTNLHEVGSGATGATNSLRSLGKRAAAFVFLFDALKAVIPALVVARLNLPVTSEAVAFAAIFGHCFPVFANFKGGKAVATSFGFFITFFAFQTSIAALFFAITFVFTATISISSLVAATITMLLVFLTADLTPTQDLFIFFIWLLLIIRHTSNIKRIISKNERESKIIIPLKGRVIFTMCVSVAVMLSSLFHVRAPLDDSALRNIFSSNQHTYEALLSDTKIVAQSNPTPETYYNMYKAQVLVDAYPLIAYDITHIYYPDPKNDEAEQLVAEYNFKSRINLNSPETNQVYYNYVNQYDSINTNKEKLDLLKEMNTYLLENYKPYRSQGKPNESLTLKFQKSNNTWLLPATEQSKLTQYLNSDVFVNGFSEYYLNSDQDALTLMLSEKYKPKLPIITTNNSLDAFAKEYITYLETQVKSNLTYTIKVANQSRFEDNDLLVSTYEFTTTYEIPVNEINAYVKTQNKALAAKEKDKVEQTKLLQVSKQQIIDNFTFKPLEQQPLKTDHIIIFNRKDVTSNWQISETEFNKFESYINEYLIVTGETNNES